LIYGRESREKGLEVKVDLERMKRVESMENENDVKSNKGIELKLRGGKEAGNRKGRGKGQNFD